MNKEEMQNKIEELENELKKLKEELKVERNKIKKPKIGEKYWVLNADNEVEEDVWDDATCDNTCYNNYNCFLMEGEAEKAQRVRETENLLRKYVEEHDDVELDWNDINQTKWFLIYNYKEIEIDYSCRYHSKYARTIYASSGEILKDAVKEIGEDRVTEYLQY